MIPWVKCDFCEDYWCSFHLTHVFECDCPHVDEWVGDPYSEQYDFGEWLTDFLGVKDN